TPMVATTVVADTTGTATRLAIGAMRGTVPNTVRTIGATANCAPSVAPARVATGRLRKPAKRLAPTRTPRVARTDIANPTSVDISPDTTTTPTTVAASAVKASG